MNRGEIITLIFLGAIFVLLVGIIYYWEFSEQAKIQQQLKKESKLCFEKIAKEYCETNNLEFSYVNNNMKPIMFICKHPRNYNEISRFKFTQEEKDKCVIQDEVEK